MCKHTKPAHGNFFTFIKKFDYKYFIFSLCTGFQVPNKANLSLPSSAGQGTENKTKMVKIRAGGHHSLITMTGKTDSVQENLFDLLAIKSE